MTRAVGNRPYGDSDDFGHMDADPYVVRRFESDPGETVVHFADDGQFSIHVTGIYGQRYVLIENIGRHIDQPCGLRLDISWDP